MYKIVFFDVDGTLLSEIDRSMPQSTKEAIKKLIDRGIKVVVATGRPYNLCEEFKTMGIDTIICANGALVKCNDKTIYKSVLRTETIQGVSVFAELNNHSISYFTEQYAMNGIGSENQRIMSALKEYVELGIAMGNAEQELKDKADFVTKKASEDGISYALQYFSVI